MRPFVLFPYPFAISERFSYAFVSSAIAVSGGIYYAASQQHRALLQLDYKGLTPCEVVFHHNVLIDGQSECKAGPDREIVAIVGLSVGVPHRAIVEDVAPCGGSIALRT